MPRPRIDIRKIREVLRLTLGEELSRRQVSAASGVPLTTAHDYLRRAASAGLKWPLPGDVDDAALEQMLYSQAARPPAAGRPLPDWRRVSGHGGADLARVSRRGEPLAAGSVAGPVAGMAVPGTGGR